MKRYVFSSSSPIPRMATHPKGNWCHWSDVTKVIRLADELQRKLDKYEAQERAGNECKECRQWRNANDELVRRATAARAALKGE